MDLVPFFVPLWLTIPAVFVTRPHAFPSLQTRLLLRAVTRLFAPLGHSGPLKAQQGLSVGLGWLCGGTGTPSSLAPHAPISS